MVHKHLTLAAAVFVATLTASTAAHAFCGFYVSGAEASLYNDATMVVMLREGKRTVLSMQNNYAGPPEDFAMVVPVPVVLQEENVKTLDEQVFADVDRQASPRLVEYWERDPCWEPEDELETLLDGVDLRRDRDMPSMAEGAGGSVRIEAQFKVGEYDIVILGADDSSALDTWLRGNKYRIPEGAEPVLRPYIEAGMYFFVAKVDATKVKFVEGRVKLSPLRFHYDSETFSLPVRLGLLNARGPQDLLVHILGQGQRYELANMPNVTIPTNLGVSDGVKGRFGEFYASLFDRTLAMRPGAVVTEYAWASETCDPCPGPVIRPDQLMALGVDTLEEQNPWGWVLTRLHARYSATDLKDDLVFRAARPIVGGREVVGAGGELEHGAREDSQNNFQGRYIIRHPWEGEIDCESPVRGVWGGPPEGGGVGVEPALDTAYAPRGQLELASVLRTPAPEIGFDRGSLAPVSAVEPVDPESELTGGCGSCAVAPSRGVPWAPGAVVACVFGLWVWRRRR